jgi:polyvinyl alcohol dehydrogenase (cytochrome)
MWTRPWKARVWSALAALLLCVAALAVEHRDAPDARAASAGDWTTYLADGGRSGFNAAETALSPVSGARLATQWTANAGGSISAQPIVADGVVYWGSWDGYEHATKTDGTSLWSVNLGQTHDGSCNPSTVGVASTATITTVSGTPALVVGGGDGQIYALRLSDGSVLWHTQLGTPPGTFLWSSPAVYNGSVYMGVSSFGDCPLIRGKVVRLDVNTGAVQNTFYTVPSGCVGGSVWGSVTMDTDAGMLYFETGNSGSCSVSEPYAEAIVKLRASDLAPINSWAVPQSDRSADSDFGATPTLFNATINGTARSLVGSVNKNGKYYALDRNNLGGGPLWTAQIAAPGDCPQCGGGSIAPSAWDGATLYVAGGATSIGGVSCKGSVRAVNPATGGYKWQRCLQSGPVLAAATAAPQVLIVGQGNVLTVLSTATGGVVTSFIDSSDKPFWGPSSISNGVIYQGNIDGTLFALRYVNSPEVTKVTLSEQSIDGPALWSEAAAPPAGGAPVSVLAWTGTDAAHHINVMTSSDGIHYGQKLVLNETSVTRPSVTVVQAGTVNVVVVAWIGTNRAHTLNIVYDVYEAAGVRKKLTLSDTSGFAPSLAAFGGQIWLGWTGTSANHSVNVLSLGPEGMLPGVKTTLPQFSTLAGPTLAADTQDNQLLLTWQTAGSNQLQLAQSADGAQWSVAQAAQESGTTPDAMAIDKTPSNMAPYYWSWQGTDPQHSINVWSSTALNAWPDAVMTLGETSYGPPVVGYTGQANRILLVWTGTNGGHNINLAVLKV